MLWLYVHYMFSINMVMFLKLAHISFRFGYYVLYLTSFNVKLNVREKLRGECSDYTRKRSHMWTISDKCIHIINHISTLFQLTLAYANLTRVLTWQGLPVDQEMLNLMGRLALLIFPKGIAFSLSLLVFLWCRWNWDFDISVFKTTLSPLRPCHWGRTGKSQNTLPYR